MRTVNLNLYQLVFVSFGARKFLTRVNQDILFNYIRSMIYSKKCTPHFVTGYGFHLHVVVSIADDLSLAQLVKEIQQNTEDFLRCERSVFPEFTGWDKHYAAITYHDSQKQMLIDTLSNQFDLHRKISFDEELGNIFNLAVQPEN